MSQHPTGGYGKHLYPDWFINSLEPNDPTRILIGQLYASPLVINQLKLIWFDSITRLLIYSLINIIWVFNQWEGSSLRGEGRQVVTQVMTRLMKHASHEIIQNLELQYHCHALLASKYCQHKQVPVTFFSNIDNFLSQICTTTVKFCCFSKTQISPLCVTTHLRGFLHLKDLSEEVDHSWMQWREFYGAEFSRPAHAWGEV